MKPCGFTRAGGTRRRRGVLVSAFALALAIPQVIVAQDATDEAKAGRKLFNEVSQPPCGMCHTLAAAGAAGEIGPNLDELKPAAERITRAVKQGVGVMPGYSETLTEEQIATLVRYVARATGAARQ